MFLKQKFLWKNCLEFVPKNLKNQRQFLWTKNPPGIRTPDLSKTKGNSFEQKIPSLAYVPQICRLLLLICQRKFMQKIWKFSLKKLFSKKLVLGVRKKGFYLGEGGNSQEKMFRSQKKSSKLLILCKFKSQSLQ